MGGDSGGPRNERTFYEVLTVTCSDEEDPGDGQ